MHIQDGYKEAWFQQMSSNPTWRDVEADTEKGEGRRRLWPSTQLVAQGTRARPRPGGGLTSGAPGPHNTLTLGKAPPQGHAHKVSSSCTKCPCHQHPGRHSAERPCLRPLLDQTHSSAGSIRSAGAQSGRPLPPAGDTLRGSSRQRPDSPAVPPVLNVVSPQHVHNTDRHGTDPTCY